MNFRPLHDRVMVKREDEEDVTKGGIIIPGIMIPPLVCLLYTSPSPRD